MFERYLQLLNEKKLKNIDVARATGIPASTFSDWKKGKSSPKIEKLQKIADYFNVSLDYLLGKTDISNPPITIEPYELLGDRLRKIRELSGKTQKDVAKALDTTILEVNNWEQNISPVNKENLNALCELYGISPKQLRDTVVTQKYLHYYDNETKPTQKEVDTLIDMEKIYFTLNQTGQDKLFDYAGDLLNSNKYNK